jgi:hypothetical protein
MTPIAFYHVYADGAWQEPVAEYREAIRASGFPGTVRVGLVGRPEARLGALSALGDVQVVAEADSGWEQVTLAALHEYAQTHDDAILYCHTKASSDPSPWKVAWRQSMIEHLVSRWADALRGIKAGADLAGAHWIDDGTPPHFSGNFWMASAAYLRTLPPCATGDRMDAEFWVGQSDPSTFNMRRGNPMGMFR